MRFIAAGLYTFMILVFMSVPLLAPRQTLFGVRTGLDFRSTPEGRQAIQIFRLWLVAALGAGLAITAIGPPNFAIVAPPVVGVAVFLGSFVALNRRLKPYAKPVDSNLPEVDLTASDQMPRAKWLSAIPLCALVATGIYLHQNWDRIPERFPSHWKMDGRPDGWAMRTPRAIYGFLVFMGALLLWLVVLNAALWYGVRRSRTRRFCLQAILRTQFAIAMVVPYVALSPLFKPSPPVALGLVIGPVVLVLVYLFRHAAEQSDPEADATPNEAWTGGMFYFNRQDPSLAVPRREGLGYSPNFAHVTSWLLFVGPIAIVLAGARWLL